MQANTNANRINCKSVLLVLALAAAVPAAHADDDARIRRLESTVARLQTALAAAQESIAALQNTLASVSLISVNGQPTVRFTGVNVQVVNGMGITASTNGTGNLIVGYDEDDTSGRPRCTLGEDPVSQQSVVTPEDCTRAGGTQTTAGFKIGSHYLVVGPQHNYSRWGGVVIGLQNTSNFDYASVSGGLGNTASGQQATVSGGFSNTASGRGASVSGGANNIAGAVYTSVSGGTGGLAAALGASVSGGIGNTASGQDATVSGGVGGTASGQWTSVSGGFANTAIGPGASVSGGDRNTASGRNASVSGGQICNTGFVDNKWIVGNQTAGCSTTLSN
jgi:hypothetical protein